MVEDTFVVEVVAFVASILQEKSNSWVFLDNLLGKKVVDRVEDTSLGQQPYSLDTQLDMQEVDMVEDTLEGVGPSS